VRRSVMVLCAATLALGAAVETPASAQSGLFKSLLNTAKQTLQDQARANPQNAPAPTSPSPAPAQTTGVATSSYSARPSTAYGTNAETGGSLQGVLTGNMQKAPELHTRVYGWAPALETSGNAGPTQVKTNINANPTRLGWIARFDQWIRASYTPLGGLPQAYRNIDPYKAGTKDKPPILYGETVIAQDPTIKNGKLTRSEIPSLSIIRLYANQIFAANAAWQFNTPDTYYFTMYVEPDGTFTDRRVQADIAATVAEVKRAAGQDAVVYVDGSNVVVTIAPGGRLPVTALTIGETIDLAEAGIRRYQAIDPSDPETYAARMRGIAQARARHAGDMGRIALVRDVDFGPGSFNSGLDPFAPTEQGVYYRVYRIDPTWHAKAAGPNPAWFTVTFPRIRAQSPPRDQAMYADMIQHFDWDYLRAVLRNPNVVNTTPYKPR
jgi:hypothetical protein